MAISDLSGTTLKGYALRERIGTGGFGAVYKAHQTTVAREVAIKIIIPHFANHPEFIRRFENEAQLVARLEHPHIVPLYDYWRDPDGAYLVMRWLRGGSLADALKNGPFALPLAVEVIDQLAGGLSVAHRTQIIHRDLKPANILLDEDSNAYLADFGIAKDVGIQGSGITEVDAIVGSPDYLAPEQARGEQVTPHTDIYSLGVVLYEMLAGQHPFPGLNSIERLFKHLNEPLPPLTGLPAEVRDAINTVIQRATAKDPAHRYLDVLEMAAAFRSAALTTTSDNLVETLTVREQEILGRIIDGKSNKQIAQELFITLMTVKWYVTQIYRKLGVRSRVQAIVRARELDLITGERTATGLSVVDGVRLPTEDFFPENPYKGLRAFQSADHQDFFGREKLVSKLVKRLEENVMSASGSITREASGARFLGVVGPSGSGKSSVVKAGLIPAVWRGELPNSEKWFVVEMMPGSRPLDELEVALTRVAANQAGGLREHLARDQHGLTRVAGLILPDDGSQLLVVIDQFEEVFTLVEDEAMRRHFLNLIHAAVTDPRGRVRVVVTLRADYYDRPLLYPDFGELLRNHLETVLPLSADELERAIVKPAEQVGVMFEPGLVAQIVSEVHYQPGALPLLQYALTELFEGRSGRQLTLEAYQSIGRTVGALAKRADEIYLGLGSVGVDRDASFNQYQETARQIFLRLVTLGEGAEDTRRRVARAELLAIADDSDVMDEVIDTFANYRLLALDNDPATRTPTVEVAHEALLREWERLRTWLNESREDIRTQRQLAAMAAEWRMSQHDTSFLARGSRLEQFEGWATTTQLALTAQERAYLEKSIAQRDFETETEVERQLHVRALEQRSVRFLRVLVGVLILATMGALGLTALAVNQGNIAQEYAQESQQVALIAGSQAALGLDDTDLAIVLALEAVKLAPDSARAQTALSEAAYAPGTIRVFEGHDDYVDAVAISPDGLTALSASWDHTLILWDLQTGDILRRFEDHTGKVTSVAFMPDGLSAISGSHDTTLIQWNVSTGEILRRLEGQSNEVWMVAISPDGQNVAGAGLGGSVSVWNIATGELVFTLVGHTAPIESLDFSSDGSQLLSASHDTTIILWDTLTGELIRRFEGHFSMVTDVTFNADDTQVASSSLDGRLILWDTATGEMRHEYYEQRDVWAVDFTLDGHFLVSTGVGGSLQVWDIATALVTKTPSGHRGTITALDRHPDGRRVMTGAADHTLRLWDLEAGQVIYRPEPQGFYASAFATNADRTLVLTSWFSDAGVDLILTEAATGREIHRTRFEEHLSDVTFSPDGKSALLSAILEGGQGVLILWDLTTWQEIRRFGDMTSGVDMNHVVFSPDGRQAVSISYNNGAMILWDVATGKEIRRFTGYEGNNSWINVTFSPDGKTIFAPHFGSSITRWDVQTGEELTPLKGHDAWAWNFVFTADGQRAFSGSEDTTSILWDVASGTVLERYGHSVPVAGVAISRDGRYGMEGIFAQLRDLDSGEVIRRYDSLALVSWFALDNRTVLVEPPFQGVELWRVDLTLDDLLTWTRANRYVSVLTCDQRQLYRIEPLCPVQEP